MLADLLCPAGSGPGPRGEAGRWHSAIPCHRAAELGQQCLGWEMLMAPRGSHDPGANSRAEQGARERVQDNTTNCYVGSGTPRLIMPRC